MLPNTNKWLDEIGLKHLISKIKSLFDKKVDKIEGKGLSSEDYTTSEKNKLSNIENGAQVNKVTGVKGNSESSYRTGNINITKANIGLSNVENKSSETIRSELTKDNVVVALGYTPPTANTTYSNFVKSGTGAKAGLVPAPSTTAGATKYLREDGTWTVPPTNTGPAGAAAGFGTPTATVDTNVGTPSVTVTAGGANTAKVFNFAFKNIKGETGAKGATGTRGSLVYWGTAITGTSTTATVFSSSGVTSALVNDMYINTLNWNVYQCTTAGAASVAKWVYVGSIKGATGAAGQNATTTAVATTSANGLMSAADKTKLDGIAAGANKYVHPTTSGNKHIPSGGSSGKILRWSADGTAVWGDDNNTDTKVLQSVTTTGNYRPILMGANNNNDVSTLEESITGQSYQSSKIFAQPSTGTFFVRHLTVRNDGNVTLTDGGSINQKQPDPTTSRYSSIIRWVPTTDPSDDTYVACIGRHNSGGDATNKGAITILPYNTQTTPWSGGVGLYIKKGYVSIDGTELVQKTSAHMSDMCNLLGEATATPKDDDYYISSYTGTDTTINTYHRRKNIALWNYVKGKADTTYLPLSGGTITGMINYDSGTRTSSLFRIDDGDANGSMYSGPHTGGLTILGSGESPLSLRNAILSEDGLAVPAFDGKFSAVGEHLLLAADSNMYFMVGCNTIANKKSVILTPTPALYPDTNETGSIGISSYKWNAMYAKTFYGALSGNANTASKLKTAKTINGVNFDGSANISITKCLYNGTGATSVILSESQSNYDLLIIVTDKGTFLHRVGSGFTFHSFNTYPTPSQNGTGYVNILNFSIHDQIDKKISTNTSKVNLKGSGTTATSSSVTDTVLIKEVYGLKLS